MARLRLSRCWPLGRFIACAVVMASVGGAGAAFASLAPSLTRQSATFASAITLEPDRSGVLYPGGPAERLAFRLTSDHADLTIRDVTVAVASDPASGDATTSSGARVAGCLARWFRATRDGPLAVTHVGGRTTEHGEIRLAMIDAPINQDACQGRQIAVIITPPR